MSSLIRAVSRSGLFRNLNLNISGLTKQNMASKPCYFSSGQKNYVVIYYPYRDPNVKTWSPQLIYAPFDKQFTPLDEEPLIEKFPACSVAPTMSCVHTTNDAGEPSLYFFGSERVDEASSLMEVYRYDPRRETTPGTIRRMQGGIISTGNSSVLSVRVGDYIYLLSYPTSRVGYEGNYYMPLFQMYNVKDGVSKLVGDVKSNSVTSLTSMDYNFRSTINQTPHIVIGDKLHASLGGNTYTFDTNTHRWEKCKMVQEKLIKCHSPSSIFDPPEPFDFFGRGILWDNNILLGVHYSGNFPVVAFELDDGKEEGERSIVKIQCITYKELNLDDNRVVDGGRRLVDLGQGGYFCLVQFYNDMTDFTIGLHTTLTIFKISKLSGFADLFIKCEFVSMKCLPHAPSSSIVEYFDAFSV